MLELFMEGFSSNSKFNNTTEANNFLDTITLGVKSSVTNRHDVNVPKWVTNNDVTKHVRGHYYKLINIPDIAAQRSAYELHPSTAGPLRPPFGYEVSAGRFTIEWMIDTFAKKVPFEFERWQDCCEAADYLDLYFQQLEFDVNSYRDRLITPELKKQGEEAEIFLHVTREFRDYLVPLATRIKNYHNRSSKERDQQFLDTYRKNKKDPHKSVLRNKLDDITYLKSSADRIRRVIPKE